MSRTPYVLPAQLRLAPESRYQALGVRFAEDPAGAAPPPADPPAAPPAAPPAPPAPGADPVPAGWDGKVESLPDPVQKMIRDLRKEAGDNRTAKSAAEQSRQELMDGIASALGLKKDDAPPDPAALQSTLAERETRITTLEADARAKDVELAAWRSATRQNVNAVALLDSRSFLAEVAGLDAGAGDFATKLDAAVKRAVDTNPTLRASVLPGPGAAGIGVTGSGGDAAVTPGLGRLRAAYGGN